PGCSLCGPPAVGEPRIERAMIGRQNGHPGDDAVTERSIGWRSRRRKSVKDGGRAALIARHPADLPASQYFARYAVVQIFLAWPDGQLVDVTENERVRRVLITESFLR